jgi:hypothetical protein
MAKRTIVTVLIIMAMDELYNTEKFEKNNNANSIDCYPTN